MIKDYLKELILQNFGFQTTIQQDKVVNSLCEFLLTPNVDSIFLLKGFAGTGKTSLISALIKTMKQIERECVLIAPTGRAAKVLSLYADHPAYTIHKRIYRQKSVDKDSIFTLNYNMRQGLLFICDEASMIANDEYTSGSMYGTGRLLDDMIHFVYGGKGCRLIIMGDTAQLPPVGEGESPALQEDMLRGYGLDVTSHTLTEVVRQAESSGILWNATRLRKIMDTEDIFSLPQIRFKGFADVQNIPGNELIETLEECYQRDGEDETIVITRSNKRAIIYNNGIRNQVLWREDQLEGGDILMVAKNNYFWTEQYAESMKSNKEDGTTEKMPFDFIANGDTCVVQRVRHEHKMYDFTFADCELWFPDYDFTMDITVLMDTLQAEAPSLTREQQDTLYNKVLSDYEEINIAPKGKLPEWKKATKAEKMKAMRVDPYYNALQIKYAYAITCHKAQGGQWTNVFIDQGYMTEDMLGPEYFRWLYTAITRATTRIFFVNWKKEQSE